MESGSQRFFLTPQGAGATPSDSFFLKQDTAKLASQSTQPSVSKISAAPSNLTIDDFEVGCVIGKGSFGRVYLARTKNKNIPVALKVLKRECITHKMAEMIANEIQLMSMINHVNIANLYTYFVDTDFLYLVLEYVNGGDLYSKMMAMVRSLFTKAGVEVLRETGCGLH